MSDPISYIRLRPSLSNPLMAIVPPAIGDEEFAAHQTEFVRQVFGYCAYLREHERETPITDAFMTVFVGLFEAMDANASDDARRCMSQLQEILRIVFPESGSGNNAVRLSKETSSS